MLVLRCTQKLLAPLARHPRDDAAVSTTRLGDWYGHLYYTRQGRFALCVNERTLLPVVVSARAPSDLLVRIRASILALLERIGASQASIIAEANAMAWIVIAATKNRSVLGSMNDFSRQLRWILDRQPMPDLPTVSMALAEIPCGPLKYRYPRDVAREMLRAA